MIFLYVKQKIEQLVEKVRLNQKNLNRPRKQAYTSPENLKLPGHLLVVDILLFEIHCCTEDYPALLFSA
jgi:hypothetical protein